MDEEGPTRNGKIRGLKNRKLISDDVFKLHTSEQSLGIVFFCNCLILVND